MSHKRKTESQNKTTRLTNTHKKTYYAYGQKVPQNEIDEIIADGISEEDLTIEFLETYYYYEHQDNL